MLLLLAACNQQVLPADSEASIDSATASTLPAPECSDLTIDLTEDLRESDLPAGGPLEHQEPGVGLADVDGDGDLDAIIAWAGGAFGMRNDGLGNLTVDDTIDYDGSTWPLADAIAFADLDGDGDQDAYLGEFGAGDDLAWNDGDGHFTSQRLSEGDSQWSPWTGAFGDADNDGDLDLYVAVRVADIEPELVVTGQQAGAANYLYVNNGDAGFVRQDARIPQGDNIGFTFHSAWVDLDGDDDLDVYEANDWGYYVTGNRFLRNDGTGYFTEDNDCMCAYPMYGMGVGIGDVNGDSRPEIMVTNLNSPVLYQNLDGTTMADATLAWGAEIPPSDTNFTSWGTSFLDFDRNGCMDIVVAFGRLGNGTDPYLSSMPGVDEGATDPTLQSNVALLNDCSPHYERATNTDFDVFLDRDRSVAVGDLDADGRPDLVTAGRNFVRVWHTGGGCDTGVTVRLSQPGLNPTGIGSRVTVRAGGRDEVQWMLPSTTHSTNAQELYFGLGNGPDAEVSVHWPDGSETGPVAAADGDVVTITP